MKYWKHGCQNLVAMETSKLVITCYKCQNVPRRFCLGKVAMFGGDSFNCHEVIHFQSWCVPQNLPPPPPSPLPPRSEYG